MSYHDIIRDATGYTERAPLQAIEDCMRDTIFHSTLDWQARQDLEAGARDAVDVLVAMGKIEPLPTPARIAVTVTMPNGSRHTMSRADAVRDGHIKPGRKIAVILENAPDCELERAEQEFPSEYDLDSDAVEEWIGGVIEGWSLSVGDTIRIVELPS